ncbi:band 7 protein [Sulfolobus islandicus Y.G.57.14]|jgi:Membrane protease subunits, stomatin/prohibitin homologs|uniref:Band 7 protein n=2 Tax=Saccharolobus islandicus TaxID=43080 RepID=C3MME0_SACI2|nr:SPFH domain-containing protein [Sulfolobus islandicus]ACP34763.1 band 7 protein [Sulfolobus islandicus L.S.2.15]ACP45011.1 band 7 protein [Sulfolobus islandicus Y.G.57.14]
MSLTIRGQVISTEKEDGSSFMTADAIIFKYPKEAITSKSFIIVQPTERAIVLIQGQIVADLPPGSHNIQTPGNPVSAFLSKFRYNTLPYDTIVYFISTTRHEVRVAGVSQTDDLVPLEYETAIYFRVQNPAALVTNVQFGSLYFKDADLAHYISPIVDQEVSSVLNRVNLTDVFKKFSEISTAVTAALKQFLAEIGVDLISVRITRLLPQDPELRRIIQLRDMGIPLMDAVRMGLARILAEQQNAAAVNMAIGVPYYPNLSTIVNLPDGLIRVGIGRRGQQQSGGAQQ